MKIICIGNYPPRKCGIATFTENLLNAISLAGNLQDKEIEIEVIAMNENDKEYGYPSIVSKTIHDHNKEEYHTISHYINSSGADICLVQHEYGIYGGTAGLLLLPLLRDIEIPIISTFHTVLQKPGFHQKEVLKKIAEYSSKIVIMSSLAINFLSGPFGVPRNKIARIEHGVPDFKAYKSKKPKIPKAWKDKKVIMTFGLIGRSKGIETAIRAMPGIIKQHPDAHYVILGKTHPHIVKNEGEEYREYLQKLTIELGVENNVQFINKYVAEEDLCNYLLSSELYITPYLNEAQITSGTLAYAVASGSAVLSTPYWHAKELLDEGRGILFEFGNYNELANDINSLLDQPEKLKAIQITAYNYGKTISWPKIGKQYINVFEGALTDSLIKKSKTWPDDFKIPEFDFSHIARLTDDTGIVQHSKFCIPDYHTGYSLDDTCRALVLSVKAYHRFPGEQYCNYIYKYLSFFMYMQNPDGDYKNFITFERDTVEVPGSDDTYGRAIWALGYVVRYAPSDSVFNLAVDLFAKSTTQIPELKYARGYANCILGLYHFLKRFPDHDHYLKIMQKFADKLCGLYKINQHDNWHWFEPSLTYDNGILPAALYKAYSLTHNKKHFEIAEITTQFLENICMPDDHLSLVGNKFWMFNKEQLPGFAQQPIDAFAMVFLYDSIHLLKKDNDSREKLKKAFSWFFGNNDLLLPLYNNETKGCHDGIEEFSINNNQGAESIISYLMSWLIAEPYYTSQ
ncbi:MAG: hypothetical protein B6D64_00055 [Bacteroidetes bacterium 4484_276]|nr:MAG: hypothetical protein B6D64_00055 [Bacteroidetes bacterium 4484_276]